MLEAKWIPNVLWSCVAVVVIGSEMCAADAAFTVPAAEQIMDAIAKPKRQ